MSSSILLHHDSPCDAVSRATTRHALLALPAAYASAPDVPIEIARREATSLANLARVRADALARIGLSRAAIALVDGLAAALQRYEARWRRARNGTPLGLHDRTALFRGESLVEELAAAARWAFRRDDRARVLLHSISYGGSVREIVSGLDLLAAFWGERCDRLGCTHSTGEDLERARVLANLLAPAADRERLDTHAMAAYELRNRAFWATQDACAEVREAGRYAFHDVPKIAWRFRSRFGAAYRDQHTEGSYASAIAYFDASAPAPKIE